MEQKECKYCHRTGYHIKSCKMVTNGLNFADSHDREVANYPIKDIPWFADPILKKRWGMGVEE